MRKSLYLAFIVLVQLLFSIKNAYSRNIVTADLTYVHISDQTYEIVLTVYNECNANEILTPAYQIDYQSQTCNVQKKINVSLQGSGQIIRACGLPTPCEGGSSPGFIKAVYKGRVNFKDEKTDGKCSDWVFSWQDCIRSKELTNIKDADKACIAVQSRLNNKDFAANNSPSFVDLNPFAYQNSETVISPNTIERDKDEIKYKFVTPKDKQTLDIQYNAPFTAQSPLSTSSGFNLDESTGEIRFTPSKANERTVFAILVEEYRNGKLVGSVTRDLQISVISGENKAPTLSGLSNTTVADTTVNTDRQFCFTLFGTDPDIGQRLTVTLENTPTGAFLTGASGSAPRARFCWTPRKADVGEKKLIFTIKDDACPQRTFTREILVTVREVSKECENLSAFFSVDTLCLGKKTRFTDFSSPFNSIVSWKWDFGNGKTVTSMKENNNREIQEITYDKSGDYNVSLKVTFQNKCEIDTRRRVKVCEPSTAAFDAKSFDLEDPTKEIQTFCSNQNIVLEDKTVSPCTIIRRNWFANDKLVGSGRTFNYNAKAGSTKITLKAYTDGNCESTVSKTLDIKQGPNMEAFGSYHFKCSDLDTTVKAQGIGGTPFPNQTYSYKWLVESEGGVSLSPSPTVQTVTINHSDSADVEVKIFVTDANSCSADTIVKIINPIKLGFGSSNYCSPGDTILFNASVSFDSTDGSIVAGKSRWGLKSILLNYGDNTTSNLLNSKKKYDTEGIYNAVVRLEDNTGCVRQATKKVFIKLPNFRFETDKDTACFNGGKIKYAGPFYQPSGPTEVYTWSSGADGTAGVLFPDSLVSGDYIPNFTGKGFIKLKYEYNETCTKEFETPLFIHPVAVANIDSSLTRSCSGVNIPFKTIQDPNQNLIARYNWQFYSILPSGSITLIEESTQKEPVIFIKNPGVYRAVLNTVDSEGCPNTQAPFIFRADSVVVPCFTFTGACASEKIFFLKDCTIPSETKLNPLSYRWEVSDGFTTDVSNPFHYFNRAQKYSITATFFSEVDGKGCKSVTTNTLDILPQPIADFDNNVNCFGLPISFTGKGQASTAPGDTLKSYRWLMDNKNGVIDTIVGKNIDYVFKNFTQDANTKLEARYIVTNSYNCSDTLSKEITVYAKPKANFSYDFVDNALTSNKPMQFLGKYDPANPETSSEDVVTWLYKFGDGNQTEGSEGNVLHTYKQVSKYNVELITINLNGCKDTIIKKLDLNAYLLVPNTITPNNDGKGDKFEIVSKGVVKLSNFKIYNRWGELVFDGGSDLKSSWDGTFNGAEQGMGVFVYYVSGTTIYGEEIKLSGNLTLVR